jgi:hypothetical protein
VVREVSRLFFVWLGALASAAVVLTILYIVAMVLVIWLFIPDLAPFD